ncbi:lysozyme [uncultured Paracoccus sp.]|uniref:lysozyme n=1 Tax=uncultured Paracoccus sp. TaxID=189685 RepID=UPI00261FE588|nr:lysozyme [uncultured Paracoccus sp.]
MTDRGLLALIRHEGIVPGPYLDVNDVWTFGIGHTAEAGAPDPAHMPRGMPGDSDAGIREAFRLFRVDVSTYETAVRRAVKVPLEPHEFDALVSFHYNTGGIAKAALTKALNTGNRTAASDGFMGWLKPAAIRPRREAERTLFATGRYPTGDIAVWAVDRHGRVSFARPIRRLTEAEALALLHPTIGRPAIPTPSVPSPTTHAAPAPEPAETGATLAARLLAFLKSLIGA